MNVECAVFLATVLLLLGSAGVLGQEPLSAPRSERSANLSHITGSSRKIRIYITNRYLQILPDGTVNGSADESPEYTILQRWSVNTGQLRIQGVATCMFLCMDTCGILYGSKLLSPECVFNETLEQHAYNTYSSSRYSNARRTLYVALNRRGAPRRVQLRGRANLGKLSAYARVLTQPVAPDRLPHRIRHQHFCPPAAQIHTQLLELADVTRCPRRRRRRKRKRCKEGGEEDSSEECMTRSEEEEDERGPPPPPPPLRRKLPKRKCEETEGTEGREKCQKKAQMISRKRKSRHEPSKKALRHSHRRLWHQRMEQEEEDEATMTTDGVPTTMDPDA